MALDYNSSLAVRTQNNGDIVIEVADGTTPSQKLAVNAAGSAQVDGQGIAGTPAGGVVSVQGVSGGTPLPVSGTISVTDPAEGPVGSVPPSDAIQIGALVSTSAPAYTSGNMEPLSLTASGAVRVDGSAVTQPINGTVIANQGTAAALAGAWPVEITDGTNVLGMSAHPVRIDPTGTTTQPVSGTVTANQGGAPWSSNITELGGSAPSASNSLAVQISTGATYVSGSNPLPVEVINPASEGTPKNYYTDSSSVAVGTTVTQSTTVGGTAGFYLQSILVAGAGKFKAQVQIETGSGTGVFSIFWTSFNSTAAPNFLIPVPNQTLVPTGAKIQVLMTNNDLGASDLYSTVMGYQI